MKLKFIIIVGVVVKKIIGKFLLLLKNVILIIIKNFIIITKIATKKNVAKAMDKGVVWVNRYTKVSTSVGLGSRFCPTELP